MRCCTASRTCSRAAPSPFGRKESIRCWLCGSPIPAIRSVRGTSAPALAFLWCASGCNRNLDLRGSSRSTSSRVSSPRRSACRLSRPRGRTRMLEPKQLTVVIVDDEAPALALIREYLEQHSDVHVVAECTNGLEAVKAANELKPDLLFLDIQMPKLDGFEVLDLIGRDAAGVVFTTAYDDYALRAFEVHAVDYLLKPFGPERFAEALQLARLRISRHQAIPARELLE